MLTNIATPQENLELEEKEVFSEKVSKFIRKFSMIIFLTLHTSSKLDGVKLQDNLKNEYLKINSLLIKEGDFQYIKKNQRTTLTKVNDTFLIRNEDVIDTLNEEITGNKLPMKKDIEITIIKKDTKGVIVFDDKFLKDLEIIVEKLSDLDDLSFEKSGETSHFKYVINWPKKELI